MTLSWSPLSGSLTVKLTGPSEVSRRITASSMAEMVGAWLTLITSMLNVCATEPLWSLNTSSTG